MFTEKQIQHIRSYVYKSECYSLFDPTLQVFWNWLFQFVPRDSAANTITCIGSFIIISTTGLMLYCNPDGTEQVSGSVYLLCGLGVFTYVTFDVLDGKQGRRTRDGALEEFFDHGLDSVSTVCVVLGACFAMQLGREPMILLTMLVTAQLSCFMTDYNKYITGIMKFARFDVIEGNVIVSILHTVCAISIESLDLTIPGCNVTVRFILKACTLVFCFVFLLKQCLILSDWQKIYPDSKKSVTIRPLLPIVFVICLQISCAVMTQVYTDHLCLFLLTFGIILSKLTISLIVSDIAKDDFPICDQILLGPIFLTLASFIDSPRIAYGALWIVCIYSVLTWVWYFYTVANEFCKHLNGYCFDVTKQRNELNHKS